MRKEGITMVDIQGQQIVWCLWSNDLVIGGEFFFQRKKTCKSPDGRTKKFNQVFINSKWRHASRYENMEEKADIITTNGDMENYLKNRLNKAAQAISMLKEIWKSKYKIKNLQMQHLFFLTLWGGMLKGISKSQEKIIHLPNNCGKSSRYSGQA